MEQSLKGLTEAEKQLLLGFFGGIEASLEAEDAFFAPLKQTRRALANFKSAESSFPQDAAFGWGAAHLSGSIFFNDNFVVNTLLGFEPSIFQGLSLLNKAALKGSITRIEALLFLNEFYAEIEENPRRAAVYSRLLINQHPANLYFNYLHGRNLLQSGRSDEARYYLHRAAVIGSRFYPFQYDAMLKEAEAYYLLGRLEEAKLLNGFTGSVYRGLDYYRLKYRLVVLENQTGGEIQAAIPAEYLAKIVEGAAQNFNQEQIMQDKKFFEKELLVKKSAAADDCLIVLTSLNQFPDKYRDKIIFTMQDFILNLNISEDESRQLLSKLAAQLAGKAAGVEGELIKIRLELYHRRFDQAAEIFARLERKHPYQLAQSPNQKRIKIWQRMISKLNRK